MAQVRIGISGWTWTKATELRPLRHAIEVRQVHAPFDAMSLAHRLKVGAAPTGVPDFSKINEAARREWPQVPRRWRARAGG